MVLEEGEHVGPASLGCWFPRENVTHVSLSLVVAGFARHGESPESFLHAPIVVQDGVFRADAEEVRWQWAQWGAGSLEERDRVGKAGPRTR